jgi:hypothetical protein
LEKNFLEKRDSQMRRQGRNRRQEPLPDKGMGVGTTTFRAVLKMRRAATRALVGDALAIWHDAQPLLQLMCEQMVAKS